MKKAVLLLVFAALAMGAQAQLRFGVKAGVGINSLHFDEVASNFDSNNRTGFTGGLMLDLNLPLGFGVDGSVMYTRRSGEINHEEVFSRDYVSIPVNVKYNFSLPVVSQVLKPFLFTGPEFSFYVGDKKSSVCEYSSCSVNWNVGAGLELFNHLQVAAAYNIGMNNSIKEAIFGDHEISSSGIKDRGWTVTAAYLF